MSLTTAEIQAIATETRQDFEQKAISAETIAELLRKHRPDIIRNRESAYFGTKPWTPQISPPDRQAIDSKILQNAQYHLDNFPLNGCDSAGAVLLDRIGYGQIIWGGYGIDDGGYYDHERGGWVAGYEDHGHRYHSFVNVGQTELGLKTIVDITADQFNGPRVYVGPLIEPWTDEPLIARP